MKTVSYATRAEYYHKDHLGNVRLTFSDLNQDGALTVRSIYDPTNEILLEKNYYPFGLEQTGPWFSTVAPDNAYRYNGKELDEATGLYDYGARYYDPAIARWGQVDPLAEKYPNLTPYHYTANNPIKFVDYDGEDYGVLIDHDKRTITVQAHFRATNVNMNVVDQAVAYWNNQSGEFEYTIGKGDGAITYQVNFQLSSEEIKPGVTTTSDVDPNIINYIQGMPDDAKMFEERRETLPDGTEKIIKPQGGSNGKDLAVKKSMENNLNFMTHEMGHNLGMNHTSRGIMNTTGSGENPVPMNVRESLGHGGVGKGRSGTTTRANVTTQSTGEAPSTFSRGKIKRVEK